MSRSDWRKDRARRNTSEWREYQRNWARNWRAANKDRYLATARRGRYKNREAILERTRVWRIKNPEKTKVVYKRIKAAVYVALGEKCIRCGFQDKRALQIDHINGGGNKDRKGRGYWTILRDIGMNGSQGKYQILCANCNQIKKAENKEYRSILNV